MSTNIKKNKIKVNKYSHLKHFEVIEDIVKGDSVLIKRDEIIFIGFYLCASIEKSIWRLNQEEFPPVNKKYNRYTLIYIYKNFKSLCISRYEKSKDNFTYICNNDDLEIYRTRVVIFEKFKLIHRDSSILWR